MHAKGGCESARRAKMVAHLRGGIAVRHETVSLQLGDSEDGLCASREMEVFIFLSTAVTLHVCHHVVHLAHTFAIAGGPRA